jgi:ATP-dependent DNA helicase RecQ
MCTLWQRFGRGARDPKCEAIALFLVEPMYFDQTKEEKAARKAKKEKAAATRKRKAGDVHTSQPPAKRARSDGRQQSASVPL